MDKNPFCTARGRIFILCFDILNEMGMEFLECYDKENSHGREDRGNGLNEMYFLLYVYVFLAAERLD